MSGVVANTMMPTKLFSGGGQVNVTNQGVITNSTTPMWTNGMNGNVTSWNNTWGSGSAPNGWTTNCYNAFGHYGSIRAEYALKLASPLYPQVSTSILQTPMNLTPGVALSAPNNTPYTIAPVTSLPYSFGGNNQYNMPNVSALMGY